MKVAGFFLLPIGPIAFAIASPSDPATANPAPLSPDVTGNQDRSYGAYGSHHHPYLGAYPPPSYVGATAFNGYHGTPGVAYSAGSYNMPMPGGHPPGVPYSAYSHPAGVGYGTGYNTGYGDIYGGLLGTAFNPFAQFGNQGQPGIAWKQHGDAGKVSVMISHPYTGYVGPLIPHGHHITCNLYRWINHLNSYGSVLNLNIAKYTYKGASCLYIYDTVWQNQVYNQCDNNFPDFMGKNALIPALQTIVVENLKMLKLPSITSISKLMFRLGVSIMTLDRIPLDGQLGYGHGYGQPYAYHQPAYAQAYGHGYAPGTYGLYDPGRSIPPSRSVPASG